MKKRIVIFISGSGSNMVALAKAAQDPTYPARVAAVICDQPKADGIAKAEQLGLNVHIIARKNYINKAAHEGAILDCLAQYTPDLLCFAGYMRLVSPSFIAAYRNRIINIHPSLLPLFKGLNTHAQALEAGMKIAGCTIHYVNEGMDDGTIISQAAVPILTNDTPDRLGARVLTVEHQLYPATLRALLDGGDQNYTASQQIIAL
ncbi:phosphoribosylglycinamide formyltransferase [Bartonella sp. DGB2]|uniref:phosphoribosylglycinamide formyltransferase n=1 Tax=Bartonella sp. DGB2 TaxID=3388426 RepID=UPI003990038D